MIIRTIYSTLKLHGMKGISLLGKYYYYKLFSLTSGPGVQCPICNWKGRQFHPFLLQPLWVRPRASCPGCGALERHRALFVFYSGIFNKSDLSWKKCLHFAPEHCLTKLFSLLPIEIEYVSSDYKGPSDGDMQDIKYPDSTFDFVLSHHVLEHVEDDVKALAEIYRVLKTDGVCYLSVPVFWKTKTKEYGHPNPNEHEHYRSYGFDITEKFKLFLWKRIDFNELLDKQSLRHYGINPEEPLFELKKIDAHA